MKTLLLILLLSTPLFAHPSYPPRYPHKHHHVYNHHFNYKYHSYRPYRPPYRPHPPYNYRQRDQYQFRYHGNKTHIDLFFSK